jgi:hypothetical protein
MIDFSVGGAKIQAPAARLNSPKSGPRKKGTLLGGKNRPLSVTTKLREINTTIHRAFRETVTKVG